MFKQLSKEASLEKAIAIFNVAREKSAFYKEKYRDTGSVRTEADWQGIPVFTKNELFDNTYPKSEAMLTIPLPITQAIITSTGGSTGMARYGMLTYKEWNAFLERQAEAFRLIGISEQDVVANLFVAGSLWPSFVASHDVIRHIGAVHLPISSNIDFDKMLDYIMEFKPTALISLPTVFVILADKILQRGLHVDFVKVIGYAGEHMSLMIRKHVHKAFGDAVNIKPLAYTSSDCGLMGYQCEHCAPNEYHLPTDFQYLEIYDFEQNKLCGPGEKGELLVTNLERTSEPIIRYRIGDVATWTGKACKCGDTNPVYVLEGRAGDDFKIGGAYISMDTIEAAFADYVSSKGISANYQFSLEDLEGGILKLKLQIESSDVSASGAYAAKIFNNVLDSVHDIKQGIAMKLVEFDVEFVNLGVLPRSPITGKVKRLNDKRVKES